MKTRIYTSYKNDNIIIRKYINPVKEEIIKEEKKFLERELNYKKKYQLNIINNNIDNKVNEDIINENEKNKKSKRVKRVKKEKKEKIGKIEGRLLDLIGNKLKKIKK